MNLRHNLHSLILLGVMLATVERAADLPSDWRRTQTFSVSNAGFVKIKIPLDTIDSAAPGLTDLRLYDDAGTEIPYAIERPLPPSSTVLEAKSFQVIVNPSNTVIVMETGVRERIGAISVHSPIIDSLKLVLLERSDDGSNWLTVVQNFPYTRERDGADITFPAASAHWLRLTLDGRHSRAIPISGVWLYVVPGEPPPLEWEAIAVTSREENPGESRVTLNLGAAHLELAEVRLSTPEPLFKRSVWFTVPLISGDAIREERYGQGTILRVDVGGQERTENLTLPLECRVPGREIDMFIQNGDSPPLPISKMEIGRRVPLLVFLARQAGTYHLLTGNSHCAAPNYDLAKLRFYLNGASLLSVNISPPADNPNYRPPEVLPRIEAAGAALDMSDWRYRAPLKISAAGAQQLELPPELLAHAQLDFADVRILRGSNQVPYNIQRTSINRSITPDVTLTSDAKRPRTSRWKILLPETGLPLTSLSCVSATPLFDRTMELYESRTDESGNTVAALIGQASWQQTPDRKSQSFFLTLSAPSRPLHSDTLFLETENGDNPPIALDRFQMYYPATRLLFKAEPGNDLFVYFGNEKANPPRYDLSLVARDLLAADKAPANLLTMQQLKKTREIASSGDRTGVVFWAILAAVVAGLLGVISRLLPKPQPSVK